MLGDKLVAGLAIRTNAPISLRMNKILMIAALIAAPFAASADTYETWLDDPTRVFTSDEVDLDDLKWQLRAVVVFGQGENDPLFREQLELINARIDEMVERDVIVIADTDPNTLSDLRRKLRPRAFMLVLMDKAGQVELRKPAPWDVRELSRSIDKMPLRQQEISDRRTGALPPLLVLP